MWVEGAFMELIVV